MKCFVISPIGQPGSETRAHADDVYECIIEPALKKTKVEGRRADHIQDVGRITKQMYDDILSADFCIAVVHGFNPNVFYELAVAHSSGAPVIILSEKGIDPPFDLKDERVFHYDLGARPIFRGDNVRGLVTMIESVRRLQGKREVPFGENLMPLGARVTILRTETNANAEHWVQLVRRARTRLYLGGIGFTSWGGMPGMREALSATAASGCEIRILTMDAQNPAFKNMLNPEVTADAAGQARGLEDARSRFRNAFGGAESCEVRALKKGIIFQQIIICDDEALVSPYLYTANTAFSPCLEIKGSDPNYRKIFERFLAEFENTWKLNAPIQLAAAAGTAAGAQKRVE
jgi:hypothetical protein